ncbi:hypothetical protein AB0469_02440 [Streptomyces sp. NPDC093801]|uniref:hypothetical protein n=1 Tax=Streptomyces sp. NPDC093801 TaxID=3155203 RepID=UPI003450A73B
MAASVVYTRPSGRPAASPYPAADGRGVAGGRTVVCVAGTIGDGDVADLLMAFAAALRASPTGIDLDLAGVTRCTPVARAALAGYEERARAAGQVIFVTAAGQVFPPRTAAPAGATGPVSVANVTAALASSGFPLSSTPTRPGIDVRADGSGAVAVSWHCHDGGRPAHSIQRTVRAAVRAALDAAGYGTVPHGSVLTVTRYGALGG